MSKFAMIITIVLITFIINPAASLAHSHLEGSTPADGEVIDYSLDVITLQFNTDINEGSKITVTNTEGKQFEVSSVHINGPSMLAQLPESLPSGDYTVNYEIIGEDSHVVKGDFSFAVDVESDQKEETKPDQNTDDQQADDTENKTAKENQATPPETEDGLSPTMITIAAVLIVAGIGLLWWMLRKRGSE